MAHFLGTFSVISSHDYNLSGILSYFSWLIILSCPPPYVSDENCNLRRKNDVLRQNGDFSVLFFYNCDNLQIIYCNIYCNINETNYGLCSCRWARDLDGLIGVGIRGVFGPLGTTQQSSATAVLLPVIYANWSFRQCRKEWLHCHHRGDGFLSAAFGRTDTGGMGLYREGGCTSAGRSL